jgi:hypothetical protein
MRELPDRSVTIEGEGVICGRDGKSGSRSMRCAPSWIPCASPADHTTPPLPTDSVPVAHAPQFALLLLPFLLLSNLSISNSATQCRRVELATQGRPWVSIRHGNRYRRRRQVQKVDENYGAYNGEPLGTCFSAFAASPVSYRAYTQF